MRELKRLILGLNFEVKISWENKVTKNKKIITNYKTKHSIFYTDGFKDKNDRNKEKLASKKQQTQERDR